MLHRRPVVKSERIALPRTVVLGTARTPFGKLGGGLASLSAPRLGIAAAGAALQRSGVDPGDVGYVLMGQVLQAGSGQIPSRQVSVGIGLGPTVGSETVNKVCASGMRAATLADVLIRAGEHDVIVAGGMESMSNAPYLLPKARFGYTFGDGVLVDSMTSDGLTCTFDGLIMAEQNSVVSAEVGITRAQQDAWALRSHERAIAAIDAGRFADEIVPVTIPGRRGDTVVDTDEGPRRDTSAERLAALPPVFSKDGATTAGNAPGVNDGAAALVLASEDWAAAHGFAPLAVIRSSGYVADDYAYLVRTPAGATRVALEKAGLAVADIDLLEVNEAFSSVALNTIDLLGIDPDRVNVNGGAVALGHPIGASGARLLGTLVHELRRRGGGIGVAAICSGAAQGDATVLEVFSG
jgi:acetyl-CoA C-acetyltransferase